ncbi:MAG: hypothetical protein AAF270_12515 [Pseudomonadota bacterium]
MNNDQRDAVASVVPAIRGKTIAPIALPDGTLLSLYTVGDEA